MSSETSTNSNDRIDQLERAVERNQRTIGAIIKLTDALSNWAGSLTDEVDSVVAIKRAVQQAQTEISELREDVDFLGRTAEIKPPRS